MTRCRQVLLLGDDRGASDEKCSIALIAVQEHLVIVEWSEGGTHPEAAPTHSKLFKSVVQKGWAFSL